MQYPKRVPMRERFRAWKSFIRGYASQPGALALAAGWVGFPAYIRDNGISEAARLMSVLGPPPAYG